MPTNYNRRFNSNYELNSFQSIIADYINYNRENQRIARYVIENQSESERALYNVISMFDNMQNRILNDNIYNNTRPHTRNTTPVRFSVNPQRPIRRERENIFNVSNFNPPPPIPNFTPNNSNNNIFSEISNLINNNNNNFFNPINISPTQEQINNATTIMRYDNLPPEARGPGNLCPISHDLFENNSSIMRINYCGHYFMATSLQQHFNNSVRCPLCRHDIRTISDTSNNNITDNSDIDYGERRIITAITNEMQNMGVATLQNIDTSNNQLQLSYSLLTPGFLLRNRNITDISNNT